MEPIKTEERTRSFSRGSDYYQIHDELSNLKGRIEALKIYLDNETYPKKEVILAMLGVEVDG